MVELSHIVQMGPCCQNNKGILHPYSTVLSTMVVAKVGNLDGFSKIKVVLSDSPLSFETDGAI